MASEKHRVIIRNGVSDKNLTEIIGKYDVCTVTVEKGERKKRSLNANALQAVWIKQIADYTGASIASVRSDLKLLIGLPVLLFDTITEEEKETARIVNYMLKRTEFNSMSLNRKHKMLRLIPVTSVMTSRQHAEYLKNVQAEYLPGLVLEVIYE